MTAPKRSYPTEFGRFYDRLLKKEAVQASALGRQVATGRYAPNPSITNIMKMMDEGWKPGYYAKLVAEFAASNLDYLVNQRQQYGSITGTQRNVNDLKAVPNQDHPNAAIGDNIHAAIDAEVNGEPIPPLVTITAQRMFVQWLEFRKQYAPQIERTEYTVWSYKHGYAGTGDLLWLKDGERWAIDTKSGTRVQPKVGLQCSAIQFADVILSDTDDSEMPMPPVQRIGVLHIRPRSIRLYEIKKADKAFEAFLACKTLFDWVRYDKDDTIGDVVTKVVAETK